MGLLIQKEDSPLIKKLIPISGFLINSEGSTQAAVQKISDWTHADNICIARAYEFFRPKETARC